MPPTLSIPAERHAPPRDIEVRPRQVKAWLDALPLAHSLETGRKLRDYVAGINGAKVPVEDRVEILEALHPVARSVLEQLEAVYGRATLPLQARSRETLALARELARALADAHKIAVVEKMAKLLGGKRQVPLLLHRAMAYAWAVLRAAYRSYTPVPKGAWKAVHEIYLYAEHHRVATEPADPESKASVNDLYCESLLLALCDPYRLAPGEMDRVLSQLDAARGAATLHPFSVPSATTQFLVPCDADRPPRPRLAFNEETRPSWRIFDTSAAVEKLRARKKALEAGTLTPGAMKLMGADAASLLGKLLVFLGHPPKRAGRRESVDGTIAVCVGLAAIAHFVSPQPAADGRDFALEDWAVVDKAARGLKIRRADPAISSVTVGEVVGIRSGEHWAVGVVRWITAGEDGALEAGLQFLSAGARAISIQPTIAANPQPHPALVLDHDATGGEALIAAPNTYGEQREFDIEEGGEVARVRATKLIERTLRFELFRVWPS